MSQVFMIVRRLKFRDGSVHQMVEEVLASESVAKQHLKSMQQRLGAFFGSMLVVPGQGPVGKGQAILAEVSVTDVEFDIIPAETGESSIVAPPAPKLIVPH